ncbi:hypothetical protein [Neomoorella thermoacetica]|uniref:hypothetical protein n=1 Tax=Neomoorella thermoacetica TaxID=1525 RepID=UPI0030D20DF0
MSVSKELLETLIRLEPAQEPNESLRKLLRQKVLSDIRKYEVISTTFQKNMVPILRPSDNHYHKEIGKLSRIILTGNWLKRG